MTMKTTSLAAAAIAALAVPSVAAAEKPDNPGAQGKTTAAEKKKAAKKTTRTHSRAFVVRGVDVSGLTITDGALGGELTLDPTSANFHARKVLELTKTELKGDDKVSFGTEGDKVLVRYVGLESDDELKATDAVKVIGKVQRDGDVNIRRITVIRETEDDTTTETEKPAA